MKVVRRYGLDQEYITPYKPEQNGMIERYFGTLKSECVWQHRFRDRDHAFEEIARWLDRYHADRPHSALDYLSHAYRVPGEISSLNCTKTEGAPQGREERLSFWQGSHDSSFRYGLATIAVA